MPFADPIVAGTTLVRSAIQSEGFEAGTTGWRIERDGTAEFEDVILRGEIVGTDNLEDGAVTGPKVAADAIATANLVDEAITAAKIATAAVNGGTHIQAASIGTALIEDAAIVAAKIADATITDAKIATLSVAKLIAGALGVTEHIESVDYDSTSEDQITGWRIDGDGTAHFTDVIVGSPEYIIDDEGNANFETVNANAEDGLTVGGQTLNEYLDARPRGIIAYGARATDNVSVVVAEQAHMEVHAQLEHGRMYRIGTSEVWVDPEGTSPSDSNSARIVMRVRDGGAAVPTTSSQILFGTACTPVSGASQQFSMGGECIFSCNDDLAAIPTLARNLASGEHRLLVTLEAPDLGPATSIDLTHGGTGNYAPLVLYVEDIGPFLEDTGINHSGTGGSGGSSSGGSTVKNFTKTYTATATKAFKGDDTVHSSSEGAQGNGSASPNGNMKTVFGFDQATIQSDLSGATITKVEVYLYYNHWHYISGGVAIIGTHNEANVGALTNYSQVDGKDPLRDSAAWNRNQGKFVTVPNAIGNDLRDGAAAGILIGPGPGGGDPDEYYGKTHAHDDGHPPRIRISYRK